MAGQAPAHGTLRRRGLSSVPGLSATLPAGVDGEAMHDGRMLHFLKLAEWKPFPSREVWLWIAFGAPLATIDWDVTPWTPRSD